MFLGVREEPGNINTLGSNRVIPINCLKGIIRQGFSQMAKGPQLKCLHTKACSMGNKQEELETMVQLKIYDIIAIKETDMPHNGNTAMGGYKISEERMGRRDRSVGLS